MSTHLLFWPFIGRHLKKNLWRSALTVLGIALGVAVMLSIHLANRTVLEQFNQSVTQVAGRANASIVPVLGETLDERVLSRMQWLWAEGVSFAPVLELTALMPHPTQPQVVQLLGLDLFEAQSFGWLNDTSAASASAPQTEALSAFKAGHVLVSRALAQSYQLEPGDMFTVQLGSRAVKLTVAGLMAPEGVGKAYEQRIIVADISVLQAASLMPGRVSRIELIFPSASSGQAVLQTPLGQRITQKLTRILPGQVAVQAASERASQLEKLSRSFRLNLQALSFIALLVAMFLMYNTMAVSVLKRRTEIATLRALGLSRNGLLALFGSECLMLGVAGSALGIGLGVALAQFNLKQVALTVQTLYSGQPVAALVIPWGDVLIVFLLGVAMTFMAAAHPLYEAISVSPALSLRTASFESRVGGVAFKLLLLGVALGLLALGLAALPPVSQLGGFPLFGFMAAFLTFFAVSLALPWALGCCFTWLHGLLKLRYPLPTLALAMFRGALGRTSIAVASLTIGIAMMVSLSVMIASFRQTVTDWVNQSLKADIFVEAEHRELSKTLGGVPAGLLPWFKAQPGVAAADGFFDVALMYRNQPARLGAGDFNVLARYGALKFLSGESMQAVLGRCIGKPAALVSESFATRHRVAVGDWLTLPVPSGPWLRLKIEGVYTDYASDAGYIVMDVRQYLAAYAQQNNPEKSDTHLSKNRTAQQNYSSIAIYLKPGTASEATIRAMQARLIPQGYRLSLRTNAALKAEVMRIFDATFAVTYALHGIAIAVAILSVLNTLFMLVIAARQEFALLKYLGFSARQLAGVVLWQSVILGFTGFVAGLGVGWLLSQVLIEVINKQSFGWTIYPQWPWGFLAQSGVMVLLSALLAGVLPARLAARTLPQEVLRDA
ncbi:MAG: ABC transporter permease [Vampirovibrionales bacterium]|nr:ABC transporter permease [Vampirovibrionales bacterium]